MTARRPRKSPPNWPIAVSKSNGRPTVSKVSTRRARCGPDAMIVDRLLPGMDGLTVIEALRKDQVRTPVLVLQRARRGGRSRARVCERAATTISPSRSRSSNSSPGSRRCCAGRLNRARRRCGSGPLELDLIERTARRGDRVIDLLPREFRLLEYMMRRSDQLLTRAMLLEEVWNYKFVPATNLVDVHMGRLRHKVDGPGETPMIHNVRGAGFILRDAVGFDGSDALGRR